jgi:hypothetical protein
VLGSATYDTAVFNARPGTLNVDLRIKLHTVRWPEGAVAEYRLIPDTWAAVEISGPEETLSRVPSERREYRVPSRIRWLYSGEELAQGDLATTLSQAAALISAASQGPYR